MFDVEPSDVDLHGTVPRSCRRCEAYREALDLIGATRNGRSRCGLLGDRPCRDWSCFLRGMNILPLGATTQPANSLERKDRILPISRHGLAIRSGKTCARRRTGACTSQCLLGPHQMSKAVVRLSANHFRSAPMAASPDQFGCSRNRAPGRTDAAAAVYEEEPRSAPVALNILDGDEVDPRSGAGSSPTSASSPLVRLPQASSNGRRFPGRWRRPRPRHEMSTRRTGSGC